MAIPQIASRPADIPRHMLSLEPISVWDPLATQTPAGICRWSCELYGEDPNFAMFRSGCPGSRSYLLIPRSMDVVCDL
jgi:hypothetical protein